MRRGEPRSQKSDCRRQKWTLGLLLLGVVSGAAAGMNPGWVRAKAAERQLKPANLAVPAARPDTDIVVGFPDSNEVRTISGAYSHQGRIFVVNNGTLVLDSADFTLRGDIYVLNHGILRVRKGRLTIPQQFLYQYGAQVSNSARLEFDSARVACGGFSWGTAVVESGRFAVTGCTLRMGFTTVSLLGHGEVDYSSSDFASEYVIFDSSRLRISRCDTALLWLGFPAGSVADITLPAGDTTLVHWEIRDGMPGVSGIGYEVTLDTMTGVLWGSFPQPGCSVTIRDSRMRTTGLLVPGPDSVHMSGLVNNQQHPDYTLPLADRRFRLVNTWLGTWNLYPVDSARFVLESSVFGEMLAMGVRKAVIQNSICDGSGGYVGTEGNSQLFFVLSMIETQVVSRDRSLVVGAASTVRFGSVNATDASVMLLMFCDSEFDPRPLDTSVVYLCDYAVPSWASVDTVLPIKGTADIQPGPQNPVRFGSYRFSYAHADSQTVWHPIGVVHSSPVEDDTMETWDTHGLSPGTYVLKLTIRNSYGDSIEPTKGVYLGYAPVADGSQPAVGSLRSMPSVVRRVLNLQPALCDAQPEIVLRDISGRFVMSLRPGPNDLSRLAPGIYFLPNGSGVHKLILAR